MESFEKRDSAERWRPGDWELVESFDSLPEESQEELRGLMREGKLAIKKYLAKEAGMPGKILRHAEVAETKLISKFDPEYNTGRMNITDKVFVLKNKAETHVLGYAEFDSAPSLSAIDAAYIDPKARGHVDSLRKLVRAVYDYRNSRSYPTQGDKSQWALQIVRPASDPIPDVILRRLGATTKTYETDLVEHTIPWGNIENLV